MYEPLPQAALNVYLSHTQRLPSAQELYADGPHVGTFAYEISDHESAGFGRESAWSLDIGWTQRAGPFEFGIDGFISDFKDFITLRQTGEWAFGNEDDSFDIVRSSEVDAAFMADRNLRGEGGEFLRVTRYQQTRARFYGGELQATWHVLEEARSGLSLTFIADQVRATDQDERVSLPRIPSRRYGVRVDFHHGPWRFQIEARHVEAPTRTAPREATVGSHTLLSTYTSYEIHNGSKTILLSLRLQNLLNHQARNTTSFVKDLAPQAGRGVNLGLEVRF